MEPFTMIALLPHGNVLSLLETERKKITSAHGGILPFYPLACPLHCAVKNAQDSISIQDFTALFQSIIKAPRISAPYFEENSVVCAVTFADGTQLPRPGGFIRKQLSHTFTLKAHRFLYGTFTGKKPSESVALPETRTEPLDLRVFQLCAYECAAAGQDPGCFTGGGGGNFTFEWNLTASEWIKIR